MLLYVGTWTSSAARHVVRLGRHDDEMTSPVVPVAGAFKTFFRGATQIGLRADVDVWGSRTVSTTSLAS